MTAAALKLATFTSSLEFDEIPAGVVEAAKLHFLDTLGCGLAAHALGVATHARSALAELGGTAEATVIGLADALPAASAAFANATLCHGLDFDDTHADAGSHVSVVVGPAALAAAEAHGSSGKELLTAIVAGSEVTTRIGAAAPGAFHERGWHPTAVCGIFGATAAACRLAGVGPEIATNALGIAGSMASGIFAYLEDGSPTKPIHAGWAAHGATIASQLAAHGASGPAHVLEGRFGLYHAFLETQSTDLDSQLADLGERWETPRSSYKLYPACHAMHGAVDAARQAVAASPVSPEEISEIHAFVAPIAVSLVLEPPETKVAPRTTYEAKFSLQYSVAAMLVHGKVGLSTYTDEAIADPRVLELAKRVTYEVKNYATLPKALPGGIRITTTDGRTLEADLPYERGGPGNPIGADEVRAKFRENAALALPEPSIRSLEGAILSLEGEEDVRGVLAPLADLRLAGAVRA